MKIRELGSNSGVKIMTYQLRTKETTRKTSQVPFGPQTQLKYQGVTQNHFPQLLGHQCPQLLVPSHWEQLLWPPPLFHSWECFTAPSVLLFIRGERQIKKAASVYSWGVSTEISWNNTVHKAGEYSRSRMWIWDFPWVLWDFPWLCLPSPEGENSQVLLDFLQRFLDTQPALPSLEYQYKGDAFMEWKSQLINSDAITAALIILKTSRLMQEK